MKRPCGKRELRKIVQLKKKKRKKEKPGIVPEAESQRKGA